MLRAENGGGTRNAGSRAYKSRCGRRGRNVSLPNVRSRSGRFLVALELSKQWVHARVGGTDSHQTAGTISAYSSTRRRHTLDASTRSNHLHGKRDYLSDGRTHADRS